MVDGYVVVGLGSGLIRAFRRTAVQAFAVHDRYPRGQVTVLMVRIPEDQEPLYRRAEIAHTGELPPGESVRVGPMLFRIPRGE